LTFLIAQPAHSHELKIEEPDHPLQWVAVIFYPVGHLLHHLIFGLGHEDASSSAAKAEQQAMQPPHTPKYNFSPRRKTALPESIEPEPATIQQEEQEAQIIEQPQESEDVYFPPEAESEGNRIEGPR
jgi:hypothetical protein